MVTFFSDTVMHKYIQSWIALMHFYVTQANFTTKPRFEIKNKRSFTEMNSQGCRVEKEYPRTKSANAKNFVHKRGLLVKFTRLT